MGNSEAKGYGRKFRLLSSSSWGIVLVFSNVFCNLHSQEFLHMYGYLNSALFLLLCDSTIVEVMVPGEVIQIMS